MTYEFCTAVTFALAQISTSLYVEDLESCRLQTTLRLGKDHQYQTKKAFCHKRGCLEVSHAFDDRLYWLQQSVRMRS